MIFDFKLMFELPNLNLANPKTPESLQTVLVDSWLLLREVVEASFTQTPLYLFYFPNTQSVTSVTSCVVDPPSRKDQSHSPLLVGPSSRYF